MSAHGFFQCREFRKAERGEEQRWICQGCGAQSEWHRGEDGVDILSGGGWSYRFRSGSQFDVRCFACRPEVQRESVQLELFARSA